MASETKNPFISVQYLRDNSIINDNVDAKVLLPIIRMAESKYIQQVIGTTLYNKLVTDANSGAISGNYQILLEDYVIPTLVQYSVYEAVPFLNYKVRNKSISKQQSDDSTAADLSELSYLRDNILNTAEFYSEQLIQYLRTSGLFPEYTTWTNGGIAPQIDGYFNGYHIPKKGIRRCFGDKGGEINF